MPCLALIQIPASAQALAQAQAPCLGPDENLLQALPWAQSLPTQTQVQNLPGPQSSLTRRTIVPLIHIILVITSGLHAPRSSFR